MARVVSLIASSTEIVCALGFESLLVGRSHECDFPESVRRLPVCTEPKFPTDGTSYQLDQRVRAILQEGLSVYRVHADRLRQLRPEVIITQSHCEVCAVSLRDVEAVVCEWLDSRPRIVSLEPNCLADVREDIGRVAEALGAPASGQALCKELDERMQRVSAAAGRLDRRPTVACIEWMDPLMAAGNWMPELVQLAGGRSIFGQAGHHSPWLSWDDLLRADPDVILILPCGWDLARTREELPVLTQREEWNTLRAVTEGRAFLADGNQYFNRPGPRLAESLEILAELLHPDTFRFGYQGSGWAHV